MRDERRCRGGDGVEKVLGVRGIKQEAIPAGAVSRGGARRNENYLFKKNIPAAVRS